MTDIVPLIDPAAEAQVDQADQRLLWSGAAANGALLLALIGFAGNADDPVAALRTITYPVVFGIAGFSFGGVAITHGLARLAQRPLEAIERAKIVRSYRLMGAFKEVLTTPAMDVGVAQLIWGDQANDQMRTLLLGRLTAAQKATDDSPVLFAEAIKALETCADEGITSLRTAQRWLWASFVAAAFGVVALVGQGWIQPGVPDWAKPAGPASAVAAPATLPKATSAGNPAGTATVPAALATCPGGAADCQPWERSWREPPPVGTVMPDRAERMKE